MISELEKSEDIDDISSFEVVPSDLDSIFETMSLASSTFSSDF